MQEAQRPAIEPAGSAAQNGDMAPSPLSAPPLSIVVLPFANIGDDPEQAYFVDGVTESLTTDLSRISGSFVIAPAYCFYLQRQSGRSQADRPRLERSLHLKVRYSGATTAFASTYSLSMPKPQPWAERFDKPIVDFFDLQDEIVSRLANTLDARLTDEEARRSERSPHPDSMELYFRGKALLSKAGTPEYVAQARRIFGQALALDPQNIEAMVWMAAADSIGITAFMSDDRITLLAAAEATLAKVLSVAPNHAYAHLIVGGLFISTNRAARGIAECERALALNCNLAEAHAQMGLAKYVTGRGAETEAHINEAFRLSPRDIFANRWLAIVGMSKLQIAADAEAHRWFVRSIEASRNYPLAHFGLSAA